MMRADSRADILVIGAGVTGASLAFHLARRRAGRVTVLDQESVGFGGSGRSAGLIRTHYSFRPEVQLAARSLEIFRNWMEIVGGPGDFRSTGFIRIVGPDETDRLRANVAMQREVGVNTRLVSCDDLREIVPGWEGRDIIAAAYEPDSGYADSAGAATDLLTSARTMGVDYRADTRVVELIAEAGRVRGARTTRGPIEAPVVVAATGPWTRRLLQPLGIELPIETEYHEIAVLRNPPRLSTTGCACIDSTLGIYFRPEIGGLTLVGGLSGPRGADPDLYGDVASSGSLAEMAMSIARRIPAMAEAGVAHGITGLYDMTPDSRPLLGELPACRGLHVAAGFSGMGFKIAPAVGLVLAELLLDGAGTTVDISAFSPTRFAEGHPINPPHEYQQG